MKVFYRNDSADAAFENCISDIDTLIIVSETVLKKYPDVEYLHIPNTVKLIKTAGPPEIKQLENLSLNYNTRQILAVGGGSTLDTAKALLARILIRDSLSLSELCKSTKVLNCPKVSREEVNLVLIPSLFGSGAETTQTATIWNTKNKTKLTLSNHCLKADNIIYDPDLPALAKPEQQIISTLDCLSHAVESCWHKKNTEMQSDKAFIAIDKCIKNLLYLSKGNCNTINYNELAMASCYAGESIFLYPTSIAHSLSYPLSLEFDLPHGLASSALLGELFLFASKQNHPVVKHINACLNKYWNIVNENIRDAYEKFYVLCGGTSYLQSYMTSGATPEQLVSEAMSYEKFYNSQLTLTKHATIDIYKNLFYRINLTS